MEQHGQELHQIVARTPQTRIPCAPLPTGDLLAFYQGTEVLVVIGEGTSLADVLFEQCQGANRKVRVRYRRGPAFVVRLDDLVFETAGISHKDARCVRHRAFNVCETQARFVPNGEIVRVFLPVDLSSIHPWWDQLGATHPIQIAYSIDEVTAYRCHPRNQLVLE